MFIHSVPSEPNKRKNWIKAIETHQEFDYFVSKYIVCELHFESDSITKTGSRTDLKRNTVPTIFPPKYDFQNVHLKLYCRCPTKPHLCVFVLFFFFDYNSRRID